MAGFDTVEVCIELERFGHPVLMGRLHRQQSGNGEIFSFEYDKAWLEQPEVFSFDPDLAGSWSSVSSAAAQAGI
jgi:serine/threonine-protein kinase HipA